MRRIAAALVMSTMGTGVFLVLRHALVGLIDSPRLLAASVVGSVVSSLIFYDVRAFGFRSNLRPAVRIVFGTFLIIGAGQAVSTWSERGVELGFEPVGVVFWAVVATSWWLIPGVAVSLSVFNHCVRTREGNHAGDLAV